VRASGVTIKDSSNADVSSNYNIHYVDNFTGSIEKILLESVISSPVKQVDTFASNAFKLPIWEFKQPMGNAMAGSPALLLPEGLKKTLTQPLPDNLQPTDGNTDNNKER
jgi:hypothetical protein